MGFAWWLCALEFELAPPKEIAIIGDGAENLLQIVFGEYRPNQVVAFKPANAASEIPLLENRGVLNGQATAYVCENFACQMPVTEARNLKAQLT